LQQFPAVGRGGSQDEAFAHAETRTWAWGPF
jgi:hypothetical protein